MVEKLNRTNSRPAGEEHHNLIAVTNHIATRQMHLVIWCQCTFGAYHQPGYLTR